MARKRGSTKVWEAVGELLASLYHTAFFLFMMWVVWRLRHLIWP